MRSSTTPTRSGCNLLSSRLEIRHFPSNCDGAAGSYAKSSVKTGCGVRCAATIAGEITAARSSNVTRTHLASRPGLDLNEAAKLSRRIGFWPTVRLPSEAPSGHRSMPLKLLSYARTLPPRPLRARAARYRGFSLSGKDSTAGRCRFRGDQHKGDHARPGAAIDPIVDRAALHQHVPGFQVDGRIVELHVNFARHDDGIVDGISTVVARADPGGQFEHAKDGAVVERRAGLAQPLVLFTIVVDRETLRRPHDARGCPRAGGDRVLCGFIDFDDRSPGCVVTGHHTADLQGHSESPQLMKAPGKIFPRTPDICNNSGHAIARQVDHLSRRGNYRL